MDESPDVVLACQVKEHLHAQDVGLYEGFRPVEAAIDVTLCREVDDGVQPLREDRTGGVGVADVAADEPQPRIALN